MIQLPKALSAWKTTQFNDILAREFELIPVDKLPLIKGASQSSYVLDDERRVMVISVSESKQAIIARVGVFFTGIVAGCSCADDPTPTDTINEYCELNVEIDKNTATAHAQLVNE